MIPFRDPSYKVFGLSQNYFFITILNHKQQNDKLIKDKKVRTIPVMLIPLN